MKITLHKLAKTTPLIRKELQASTLPVSVLAKTYNISESTVRKWKGREDVNDRSHARHNTLSKLSSCEEEMIKALRLNASLTVRDITEVLNRCVNVDIRKSSVHRAMKRMGIDGCLQTKVSEGYSPFHEELAPGYIHLDTKFLTKLGDKRSYVYVAIDRFSRYVYAEIHYDLKPSNSADFLERFLEHFHRPVHTILTDNGMEWTDRCAGKVKARATGNHAVDQVCARHGVKHKLTRPRRPQTNGMVERFNRRIQDAIMRKGKIAANSGRNVFTSHEERNSYILDFVDHYNQTRLACLKYQSPTHMLIKYDHNNNTDDHPGPNIATGMTTEGETHPSPMK